ncbi:restriction endonuclease subunit S [Vibrio cyclitrophicus]|uniref:restriction endonuclease subunit S n=1 Tax=Vibrio cyclitrophicus TaxID=47951 RepID=UPI000C830AEF|nr:hypothetical protein BCU19_03170 [Vibrio cyclitrophicus]
MSCNWRKMTLKEAGVILIDCDHKTPKAQETGRPYVGIPQLKDCRITLDGARLISEEDFSHWRRKAKPQEHDVILSRRCNPGETGYVTGDLDIALGQNLVLLRSDGEDIYPPFLRWLTRGKYWWNQVNAFINVGAVFESLKCVDIPKFEILVPSIEEQKLLTNCMSAIDDKIALNSKTNQTLEEMAQAIFKSWFVDFDPVKAKMNGEEPEGMDAATVSLFPEKLVESELGLIPEGWNVESAKSQLDVLRGFSYKGKGLVASLDEGVPMHNLNSVLEGGGYKYKGLKFYSDEFKDKFLVQEGDVLVANTEQGHNHLLIGYGAMIPKHLAFGFCSHHTYRVRPKSDSNVTPEFIERLFGKGRFVRQVQGFTNGTTVNMLPVAGMEMPEFVVPPRTLAEKYSELVKPMKAMIEENHKSNIELAKLRDTLLPKLLSGEIELATEK